MKENLAGVFLHIISKIVNLLNLYAVDLDQVVIYETVRLKTWGESHD